MHDSDVDRFTESLCLKETAFWQARRLDYQTVCEEFELRNQTRKMEFLFKIRDGRVSVADKAPERADTIPVWRPPMYLKFLNDVVSQYCPDLETDLIINVGDGGVHIDPVPVFVFQKRAGSNAMLLPDVDFLEFNFYESRAHFEDDIEYGDKANSAVFAGSATGGPLSLDDVVGRTLPRLRSAVAFKSNPRVDFRIPVLPHWISDEARAAMEDLGFGRAEDRLTIKQQFKHRFMISMDGWGATCSRLPIVLASNSVLLKYDSPHLLYYFSGLIPWFHFIPIGKDDDVTMIVRMEERKPGTCAAIVGNANRFAASCLNRTQVMKYTALLLRTYAASIESPGSRGARARNRDEQAPLMDIMVHIEGEGDAWFGAGEWAGSDMLDRHIEGVMLRLKPRQKPASLTYTTLGPNGSWSSPAEMGRYCGSKGSRTAIHGFSATLPESLGHAWELRYSGRFVDGSEVGPLRAGEACGSPGGAALNALRFQFNEVAKADGIGQEEQS